ncbi:MAG TPA: hypothetical protein VFP84_33215, partial [Kofleriaceae bacterium]|nr:hypothetical protein [Kofleriaceae bacterium]
MAGRVASRVALGVRIRGPARRRTCPARVAGGAKNDRLGAAAPRWAIGAASATVAMAVAGGRGASLVVGLLVGAGVSCA